MTGRPTDWHLVGRESDPTPGDPDVLLQWERYFRRRSQDAEDRMTRLRSIQFGANTLPLEGSWITAIWGRCDYLADPLVAEWSVHQEVADAFAAFRRQLPELQREADTVLAMARRAVEARAHATGQLAALLDENAVNEVEADVCAPAGSERVHARRAWQDKLDDATSTLATARHAVETTALNFGSAVDQMVMALQDSEQCLGQGVLTPLPPDTDRTKPKGPGLGDRVIGTILGDVYGLAAVTASTLKGADDVGMNVDLMMMGGPEGGGPGDDPALAGDSSLADAYASGHSPLSDYDLDPADLDSGWLKAWANAGGDVRDQPRNQRPFTPPPPPNGPGEWVIKPEAMSQDAADHQEAATGARWPWVYQFNGKDWDGYRDGTLLDAKDNYNKLIQTKTGAFYDFAATKEAKIASNAVAKSGGHPVEYVCSNSETANAFRRLFAQKKIRIKVVVLGQ